jgi:hypothetical protein
VQFLPELCTDHETLMLGSLASARVRYVEVPRADPAVRTDREAVEFKLRERRGIPLDEIASFDRHRYRFPRRRDGAGRREPDRIAVAAPSNWTRPAADTLRQFAPILGVRQVPRTTIDIASFVFEDGRSGGKGHP